MLTAFYCPILCALSSAYVIILGVQKSSANTIVDAAVSVKP